MGVTIGFVGSLIDNLYWAIPWSLDFIHHPATDAWIKFGVYFNIFDRQLAGIAAAYCHVRAAVEFTDDKYSVKDLSQITILATVAGLVIIAYLWTMKG